MSTAQKQKGFSALQPAAMNVATPSKRTRVSTKASKNASAILVADVDLSNLRFLTSLIEKEGFSVVIARDGREAHRILQGSSDFVAAIFEAVIPHISGPDLVRYMKREDNLKKIPVMMMTRTSSVRLLCESFNAGATVLLPEPFTTSQVQNLLHMLGDPMQVSNQRNV